MKITIVSMDNDDCLHKDYVEVVQSYFDNQNHLAIDFIDGYTVFIRYVKLWLLHKNLK